jgi:hypothetical protein
VENGTTLLTGVYCEMPARPSFYSKGLESATLAGLVVYLRKCKTHAASLNVSQFNTMKSFDMPAWGVSGRAYPVFRSYTKGDFI